MPESQIVVVDFGSQYTQLIARRVREQHVYCTIVPFDIAVADLALTAIRGFILSGGPESVHQSISPEVPEQILHSGKPILGICYGMQTIVKQLGGVVEPAQKREFGPASVCNLHVGPMLHGLGDRLDVWMSHGDRVIDVPESFDVIARTESAPIAGIYDAKKQIAGLQFHPEVTHTTNGDAVFARFLFDICRCQKDWDAQSFIDTTIDDIRTQVANDNVVLGLSGGVDSSVAAALISRAVGDQLTCLLVDNGLLRKGEITSIERGMEATNALPSRLKTIDAQTVFLHKLKGISDPEEKRLTVGRTFIEVFEQAARKIQNVAWLAQGTIYPDVVESAATKWGKAHVIKSHHNVGGLPERLELKLLEPLRNLFKDEVREVGLTLGLPHSLIDRHPFPGPGLSVRVLGEVKPEFIDVLREADAIYIDELKQNGWYEKSSQAFAVFLPVKSVGVVGDTRTYDHVIALRCVRTTDFMTADVVDLPIDMITYISNRIVNEVKGVSRVVYDTSTKPPATIEWE